ncbi:MAG TPA: class I SAM-dependent methyltransferase, partial [Elusimicrobiota bacterium]|nr:class I SAM-dependent methyltransferase [Elusimicrobiota bacterium]
MTSQNSQSLDEIKRKIEESRIATNTLKYKFPVKLLNAPVGKSAAGTVPNLSGNALTRAFNYIAEYGAGMAAGVKRFVKKIPVVNVVAQKTYHLLKREWWRGVFGNIKNFPVVGECLWWAYMLLKTPQKLTQIFAHFQMLEKHVDDLEKQVNEQLMLIEKMNRELADFCAEKFVTIDDDMYLALEREFRGPREMIRQRVSGYLPYLKGAGSTTQNPILDIACGRGEWLEILKEHRLIAQGVDSNSSFVRQCR